MLSELQKKEKVVMQKDLIKAVVKNAIEDKDDERYSK
tara:strand:+ start:2763 stop:2873 length:111 start_codon:yes stop_codon:yes gene_type:complete